MPPTITRESGKETFSRFERMWDILSDPAQNTRSKLEQLIAIQTDEFNLDHGCLTRIDEPAGTLHLEVLYGPHTEIQRGDDVPLLQTYCRKTIEQADGTMIIDDTAAEGWHDDPAFEASGFTSYVGTTVTVDGDLYGTLWFANTDPRAEPLTSREIRFVEMLGQWVSYELNQWTGPPTGETAITDTDGEAAPLSPQLDNMMDALGSRPRRFILNAVLESRPEDEFAALERAHDAIDVQVQLYHIHLPKLEAGGYIEWDCDTNTISRGPNFSKIKPVLRLLKDYIHEFDT